MAQVLESVVGCLVATQVFRSSILPCVSLEWPRPLWRGHSLFLAGSDTLLGMVNKYLTRLIYREQGSTERVNDLVWPFLFASLIYGLGFATLGWWDGVSTSSLYKAMNETDVWLPEIWGTCAALASILALVFISTRKTVLGEVSAFFGFLVWAYAVWVYAEAGFWLVVLTVALTNAYFWGWLYLRTKWHKHARELGKFHDPDGS